MASKETKEKILETALKLFNKDGFVNVRLQHICDDAVISLGNISYHYRTKDDIVFALWKMIEAEQKILMTEFKTLPLFEDIERYIFAQFQLQQKNLFFYTDTLEIVRSYPQIAVAHRNHIQWQEKQLAFMFKFNEARGAFIKDEDDLYYDQLAATWLWASENWINRQSITNGEKDNYQLYNSTLWSLLKPNMTQQGKNELNQLYNLNQLMSYE